MAEQQLAGGNMTEGIVRVSDTVRHPAHANSEFVLGLASLSLRGLGVALDAPAAGVVAEVVDHPLDRPEAAVAVAERDVDAGAPEADDVGPPVAGDVGEEAGVALDAPATGVVAEVVDHPLDPLGAAVAVAERHVDADAPEADDVRDLGRHEGLEDFAICRVQTARNGLLSARMRRLKCGRNAPQ
jgi:hypothetical protein